MKKIKFFLCVALFGAVSFGAFSAYDHYTMSADERALLENVEALTNNEGDLDMSCYRNCWPDSRYDCTIVLIQGGTGQQILEFTCEYFKKLLG